MRVVTNTHLERLQDAANAVGAIARNGSATVAAAHAEFAGLMQIGDEARAAETEARALGKAHVSLADAGARLEVAAVGFLGLRRWPGESVPDYLERISAACSDLSQVLATQRANGIAYRP